MAKKSKLKTTFVYECLVYEQRTGASSPPFCLFHAPAGEILQWSDIKRLESSSNGPQRSVNETKVRSVARYLEDDVNTIPTSVIVGLNIPRRDLKRGTRGQPSSVQIKIKAGNRPGIVIDGQHRLLGAREFDAAMHLNVVALLTSDFDESAFQFLIINNKASKVSTDHIKALLTEREDAHLADRLQKSRLSISKRYGFVSIADCDEESPFRQLIDWPTNRDGNKLVKPAAIEVAIKEIQEKKIPELHDEDTLIEYFFSIWRVIKQEWPHLWDEESKLIGKVGIVCMTQYLSSSIVSSYDLGELNVADSSAVKERVRLLIGMQKPDFWTSNWSSTSYDTQAGRKIIVESLVQIARNVRQKVDWKADVVALGSDSGLDGDLE